MVLTASYGIDFIPVYVTTSNHLPFLSRHNCGISSWVEECVLKARFSILTTCMSVCVLLVHVLVLESEIYKKKAVFILFTCINIHAKMYCFVD